MWSKVNRPKSSEIIVATLGSQLKFPVVTRWNSLYDSIKNLLIHKKSLFGLCQKLEIEPLLEQEYQYLEEYVQLLQPIAEAIDFLQGDNGMLYGYLIPALATIKTKYAKLQFSDNMHRLKPMVGEMVAAINRRFSDFVNLDNKAHIAIVASILCPMVKSRWIKAIDPDVTDVTEAEIIKSAKNAVVMMAGDDGTPSAAKSNMLNYFDFDEAGKPQKKVRCKNYIP